MDVLDLEGIDDDLEDMEAGQSDLDRPMSRLSVSVKDEARPTANELRLGKKVLDLEREREALAAELKALKAKHTASSTTIPVPPVPAPTEEKIEIPQSLLPILGVMRHHISELTRDNHAMRYTFGLDSSAVASSSKVTLDSSSPIASKEGLEGVDLKAVVERVRALVKENEELGEMMIEAGKGGDTEEWERALEDSKKVITSLDADLQHHTEIVQKLRQDLEAYSTLFGPLPKPHDRKPGGSTSTSASGSRDLLSPPPRSQSGSQSGRGHRQGGGQRHGAGSSEDNRRHREHERSQGGGASGGTGGISIRGASHSHTQAGHRDRVQDRDRDRDRDRGKEGDRDRNKDIDRGRERGKEKQTSQGANTPRGGASDFGPGNRREDDRASKRRR